MEVPCPLGSAISMALARSSSDTQNHSDSLLFLVDEAPPAFPTSPFSQPGLRGKVAGLGDDVRAEQGHRSNGGGPLDPAQSRAPL